jgi:hypothetical protein
LLLRVASRVQTARGVTLLRAFQRWSGHGGGQLVTAAAVSDSTAARWRRLLLLRCEALVQVLRLRVLARRFFWWRAASAPGLAESALAHRWHKQTSWAIKDRVRQRLEGGCWRCWCCRRRGRG